MKSPFVCIIYLIGEYRVSISIRTRKLCTVQFHQRGTKVPSTYCFTNRRNPLVISQKIVELGFSQFCLLCALVRLWVELTCIRRTKIFQLMMARTPETYPSSTSHDNFYDSGITTRGKTSQWRSVDWLRWLKQFFECRIFHLWRNNSGFRELIRNWR